MALDDEFAARLFERKLTELENEMSKGGAPMRVGISSSPLVLRAIINAIKEASKKS